MDIEQIRRTRDLLQGAKSQIESARINAPVPLAIALDLATVAISLQRDINKIQSVIDALNKDACATAQEINIIMVKTK